jgi:hypothetical protein
VGCEVYTRGSRFVTEMVRFAVGVEDVVLLRDIHMNRNKVDAKNMMGFVLPR